MDINTSAAYLYDGGWRKEDKEQLIKEYELSEDEADAIALELEKIEQEQPYWYKFGLDCLVIG